MSLLNFENLVSAKGKIMVSAPFAQVTKDKKLELKCDENKTMTVVVASIPTHGSMLCRCNFVFELSNVPGSTFQLRSKCPEFKYEEQLMDCQVKAEQNQTLQVDVFIPKEAVCIDLELVLGQGRWILYLQEWQCEPLWPRTVPEMQDRNKPVVVFTENAELDTLAESLWTIQHTFGITPLAHFINHDAEWVLSKVKTMQLFESLPGVLLWDCSESVQGKCKWIPSSHFDEKIGRQEWDERKGTKINLWNYKLVRQWMLSHFGILIVLTVRKAQTFLPYALKSIARQTSRLWHLHLLTEEKDRSEVSELVRSMKLETNVQVQTSCHLISSRITLYMDDSFLLVPSCITEITRQIDSLSSFSSISSSLPPATTLLSSSLSSSSLVKNGLRLEHFLTRLDPQAILELDVKADVATWVIRECGRLHRAPCHVCRRGFSNRLVLLGAGPLDQTLVNSQHTIWACQIPS